MPTMKREHLPIIRPIFNGIKTLNNLFCRPEKLSSLPSLPSAQFSVEPDPHRMILRNSRTSSTRAYYDQPYPPWAEKK